MKVCVVGTGYVGLTTGVSLAYLGHEVTCVDLDQEKVDHAARRVVADLRAVPDGCWPRPPQPDLHHRLRGGRAGARWSSSRCRPRRRPTATPTCATCGRRRRLGRHSATSSPSWSTSRRCRSAAATGSSHPAGVVRARHGRRAKGEFAVAFARVPAGGLRLPRHAYPDRIVIGGDDARLEVLNRPYRASWTSPSPRRRCCRAPTRWAPPAVSTDLPSAELIKYAAIVSLALKISFINEIGQLAGKVAADIHQVAGGRPAHGWVPVPGAPSAGEAAPRQGHRRPDRDRRRLPLSTCRSSPRPARSTSASAEEAVQQAPRRAAHPQGPQDRPARPGVQAQHRRPARLARDRHRPVDDRPGAPGFDCRDPIAADRFRAGASVFSPRACARHVDEVFDHDSDAVVLVTEWPQYLELDWGKYVGLMRTPIVLYGRPPPPRPGPVRNASATATCPPPADL